jgi:hypothetical protein
MRKVYFPVCLILLVIAFGSVEADVPQMVNYQGRLTDSGGEPLDTTVSMTFSIYDVGEGGAAIWSETHSVVEVVEGLFCVILGSAGSPLPDSIFSGEERYLGVTVGDDAELIPRTRLVSAGYAHRVASIDGARAGSLSGVFEIGPGTGKDGRLGDAALVVRGDNADSVVISPVDDITIYSTNDNGDETALMTSTSKGAAMYVTATDVAKGTLRTIEINPGDSIALAATESNGDQVILITADPRGGAILVTATDVAKGTSRRVEIVPRDSIVLRATEANDDEVVLMTANSAGGAMRVSATDVAKATAGSVTIDPAADVALLAQSAAGDSLVNISTDSSSGHIALVTSSGRALRRVDIGQDGIYFFDNTRADTTMIIHADGSITGKGQLAMGQENGALADWSNVLGYDNDATGDSSVVSGGYSNVASGRTSTVSGGYANTATGNQSTVSGGFINDASGFAATISGGTGNTAFGNDAAVGGGNQNYAAGQSSTVAGGMRDSALGEYSVVCGGRENSVDTAYGFVGGGYANKAFRHYCVVVGGNQNTVNGHFNSLVGGDKNYCAGDYTGWNSMIGGEYDTCTGHHNVLCGGDENYISSSWNVLCGGAENRIDASQYNFIGGGHENTIGENAGSSVILGGSAHALNSGFSTILGGIHDTLGTSAGYSMVFGAGVYLNTGNRVAFFRGSSLGKLGINRDDNSGGISYPIHVGTSTSNGNGAYLSAGGTWTNGSSRSFKENFQPLDGGNLLEKIEQVPVESWNYRDTEERHIGPVAEDFVSAFDVGTTLDDGSRDNKYLSTMDVAGVALAAVKELMKKNQNLEEQVRLLEARLAELESQKR